jgi:hypothetical protein
MGIADLAVWGQNARARKTCIAESVCTIASWRDASTTVSDLLSIDAARKGAADA